MSQNDAKKSRERELESKLSSLLSAVSDVKREMNSLKPVFSIPQELLVEIFHQLGQLTSRTSGSYKWTVVSWVCHHWRETALQHSRLWDHLIFEVRNSRFVKHGLEEVLNRSGQAPLVVRMGGIPKSPSVKHVRAVRAVLEHISHIQSLSLTVPGWIHREVSTLGIAHLLEELDVTMDTTPDFSPENPDLFPKCRFPALQRVVTTRVPYFVVHPLLSSRMTQLKLGWCTLNESESLLFIDILNTLHNLHVLYLSLVTCTWVHSGAMSTPQAILPRLRLLKVFISCGDYATQYQFEILDHLTIPPNANLKIDYRETQPISRVPDFAGCIANLVRKSSIGNINPLVAAHLSFPGCNVAARSRLIEIEDVPISNFIEEPQLDVSILTGAENRRLYAWLVPALRLMELQVVIMHDISIDDTSTWHEIFSMLTKLRVLRISGIYPVFSDVYRLWTLDTSTTDAGIDVFPSLKKLELICSSISGEEDLLGLLKTKRYEVSPITMRVEDEYLRLQSETWEGFRAVRVV